MTTTPKAIVEVMDAVAELVEEVHAVVVVRIAEGLTFIPTNLKTLEAITEAYPLFSKLNPQGAEVIREILAEEQYQERYEQLGEMAVQSMETDADELLEGETGTEFMQRTVEANTFFAVMQTLDGFTEIDFNSAFTLSQEHMQRGLVAEEEIVVEVIAIVREGLVIADNLYTPDMAVLQTMTSEQFGAMVKLQVKLSEESPEAVTFSKVSKDIIDVEEELGRRTAHVHMKMMEGMIDSGEMHPIEMMLNLDTHIASYLEHVMSIIVESYHSMKMDGQTPETVDVRMVIERIEEREE